MTTALYTHSSSFDHDTSPGHPESIARIEAVVDALSGSSWNALRRLEAPRATETQLQQVHDESYINLVQNNIPEEGYARLDADTILSPGSEEAAFRAAGAIIAAVDQIVSGKIDNAFCAVRPPGHHAEPRRGMGFCLFNNVAIGAMHARVVHGLTKIAIVDFDVHHGNGTQTMFCNDPNTLFASTHQFPHYPGTGASNETGLGNIFNAPMAPNEGGTEFRAAMENIIFPALRDFKPDMVFISAGFDAHARDPLASIRLEEADFEWATQKIIQISDEFSDGRLVSTLEGGYDLVALGNSVQAHVGALSA
tara:strand:+ start:65 stop:988 length:924 start_codon:yes stop_codon:yes gene_type:complete